MALEQLMTNILYHMKGILHAAVRRTMGHSLPGYISSGYISIRTFVTLQ